MRIGIDFDNTIADYGGAFHAAALERGLITADLPKDKNAVREFFNRSGRNHDFTALQGYVYGARMDLAKPYAGVSDFIGMARDRKHELFIVSHKTRYPLQGPRYDMQKAARDFLLGNQLSGSGAIPEQSIFFEETKDEKVARAAALDLHVFIDDLPEILTTLRSLPKCRRILFAPARPAGDACFEVCRSWSEVSHLLFDRAS
jgi:hypothetical protein